LVQPDDLYHADNKGIRGTIFNIQRYALHDGPGIRTTVFLKGCPLKCWWCHNPESLSSSIELTFWPERCLSCNACSLHCPQRQTHDPIGLPNQAVSCELCGKCAAVCPSEALEIVGRLMSVEETVTELQKDSLFYLESGGGVTFSGGEPLMQPEYLTAVLTACRANGWHTTVDTSGYAPEKIFHNLIPLTDLFLYDLKHLDDVIHRKVTGVSNVQILRNLDLLLGSVSQIQIRFPVIPGINDAPGHLHSIGRYLSVRGIRQLHLLPYHTIGLDKYKRRSIDYLLSDLQTPSEDHLNEISAILAGYHLDVHIGG
jgi:pyruvate formate lyase activating enzyme